MYTLRNSVQKVIFLLLSVMFLVAGAHTTWAKRVHIAVVDTSRNELALNQVRALQRCGAKVSVVTSKKKNISKYDGLVVPGGGDVNPARYHKRNRGSSGIDNRKDSLQIYMVKRFFDKGKPILGICRGAQIINVALGGTLRQDIGSSHMGRYKTITFSKNSWLRSVYGSRENVVHFHHQVCSRMGRGLQVTSRSADGRKLVEGFQHKSKPVYGVQWHPELMGASFSNRLYSKFLRICKKYR